MKTRMFGAALAIYLLMTARSMATSCVLCLCGVSSSGIVFGTYLPTAATPANSPIAVNCLISLGGSAGTVAYTITLSTGNGSFAARKLNLLAGGSTLNYNLYTTSADATVWGDGTAGTGTVSDSYTLSVTTTKNYYMYGNIPVNQNVPPGSYSDSITVTISY